MVFVQYGCGLSAGEGWLNFDASPRLRIERLPAIGGVVSDLLSTRTVRFPNSVRFGDIRKGPLVAAGAAQAVYASHVLEHLSLADFRRALVNTHVMLADGGVFRFIVPDLRERARRYVANAQSGSAAAETFMRSTFLGRESRPAGVMGWLSELMGNPHHLWMWDEPSLAEELSAAGFVAIRRCEMGDSEIGMFSVVEDKGRFYDHEFEIEECAMEARKPARA